MSESIFLYGMRLRGFSPGCQPMNGFLWRQDDTTALYHDILAYNRPLTQAELRDYELDPIRRAKMNKEDTNGKTTD